MYRTFTYPKPFCRLANGSITLDYVICHFYCSVFNIFFHKKPLHTCLYIVCRGNENMNVTVDRKLHQTFCIEKNQLSLAFPYPVYYNFIQKKRVSDHLTCLSMMGISFLFLCSGYHINTVFRQQNILQVYSYNYKTVRA